MRPARGSAYGEAGARRTDVSRCVGSIIETQYESSDCDVLGRARGMSEHCWPVRVYRLTCSTALTVVSVSGNRKKPKKPPIEKKSVLARLQRARDRQLYVSVRRWIPDSERVDGFVLALGEKWVALAELDGVSLYGWCLLRLKDIQAVFIDPDSLATKVLQARDQWPPQAVDVSLDDAAAALSSTTEIAPLISIFVEFDRPDIMWLGSVTATNRDRVLFLEVSTLAEWHRKPRIIDLEDVTRIAFGGSYEEGLALVAGPRPVK